MRAVYILRNPVDAKRIIDEMLWPIVKGWLIGNGTPLVLNVKQETRTTAQNSRLWALLTDVANQVNWHGRYLLAEEWKHVFSASLKKQVVVPGLEGGFVVLGQATSTMTKAEMSELQELIEAFGVEHGVKFTAPEGT